MSILRRRKTYIVLVFGILLWLYFPQAKGYAVASDYTADQAIAWVKSKEGKSVGYDDGTGYYQCVEFIQAYYEFLGVGKVSGSGYQYATNTLPDNWTRTPGGVPQKGDILVYSIYSSTIQQNGHVAIYESDNSLYDQNGDVYGATVQKSEAYYKTYARNYWGCIHPNFKPDEMTAGYDRVLPDGDYIISSAANPFYILDIEGTKVPAQNHDNVQLRQMNGLDDVNESDIWTITYDSSDKFYTIQQKGTNMSLDADTTSTNIQVYASSANNKAQKWAISRDESTGGYRLQAARNSLSVDVNTAVIADGQNVQQYTRIDYKAQSWLFIPYMPEQPIETGRYVLLYTKDPTRELFVTGDSGDVVENTPVKIWSDTVASQYNSFELIKLPNGYYKVKHVSSGKCLDVTNGSSEYKTKVIVHTDNGSLAQQWAVVRNDDESYSGYSLIARCNGYALDLHQGITDDGMQLQVYPRYGNDHQRWTLMQAEHTVNYCVPDADSGVPAAQTKYYKTELRLSDSVPVRAGYRFLGWATSASATAAQIHPGDTSILDVDMTLYAVWEIANTAPTVNVSANGNTVCISWNSVGASSYYVYIYDVDNNVDLIGENVGTVLSYTWPNDLPSGNYRAYVRAYYEDTPVSGHKDFTIESTSNIVASGECGAEGENLTWALDNTGLLKISGSGAMRDESQWREYAKSIQSVIMDEGITSIGYSAFGGCKRLTSIVLPESLTSIGGCAFANCDSLTSITIPAGVTNIGYVSFSWCSSLTSIEVDPGNQYYSSDGTALFSKDRERIIVVPGGIAAYTIPSGVTGINEGAFYGCTGLTGVTIPESVSSIGTSAFFNCSGLTSITIPSSIRSIGNSAFTCCNGLTDVYFTGTEEEWAAVTKGSNNTPLEEATVHFLGSMTTLSLPAGTQHIEEEAFRGVAAERIVVPEGTLTIGSKAFADCAILQIVVIPASIDSIEADAFSGSSITVFCPDGSSAAAWCEEHNIPHYPL